MNKVFLGGTCNNTTWRDKLIKKFKANVSYFNPVVEDWTPECQKEEERQKQKLCNYHLYVITPFMTGVFSIAEAVESAMTTGKTCLFLVLQEDTVGSKTKTFDKFQMKSLKATSDMIERHGGKIFTSLSKVAEFINDNCQSKKSIDTITESQYVDDYAVYGSSSFNNPVTTDKSSNDVAWEDFLS